MQAENIEFGECTDGVNGDDRPKNMTDLIF